MAALDPRLMRRAHEARVAFAADAVLGVATSLLILIQAVLLARCAARAFDGASLGDLIGPLSLLAAVVIARAATGWGFETVGRRAAAGVLSRLRLELVERRLAGGPAATDDADCAEVATIAVTGVDALETTFARYLPQVVLAVVVPVAVRHHLMMYQRRGCVHLAVSRDAHLRGTRRPAAPFAEVAGVKP